MKLAKGAYWVGDDTNYTLYVDGQKRAEADTLFNFAVIYRSRGMFRKPETETLVTDLSKPIVAEVESRLAYSALPVLDKDGRPLADARTQMEEESRYYAEKKYLETDHPARDARALLDRAHHALNIVARESHLNSQGANARDLCAKARLSLGEGDDRALSKDAAAVIKDAAQATADSLGKEPLHHHIKLSEAKFWCDRAAQLAARYGETPQAKSSDRGKDNASKAAARWQRDPGDAQSYLLRQGANTIVTCPVSSDHV